MTESATRAPLGEAPSSASGAKAPLAAEEPRSARELSRHEFGTELSTLRQSRLFWVGVALKVVLALCFGSHFATRWFAPFAYEFVHSHFANPWDTFLARGEPMAFPYGPGMLLVVSVSWLPALVASFDPASFLGLFLLRIPLFAADLTICVLLMRWLRMNGRDAVIAYWLSPVVLYATYVHGQLDLIPTALLCVALFLIFTKRVTAAALVFGFALATKAHLLIATPFALVYLHRTCRPRREWLKFGIITAATALLLYAIPLSSHAFRSMVLGSAESRKVWLVSIPYGTSGLVLYVAPAAIVLAVLRFLSYRKVNRELSLMFIGAVYVGLVALVPPQPGWFIWSIPFIAYLGARFTRTGRFVLLALSASYLAYFFIGDPQVFLEAADPLLGAGFGQRTADALTLRYPGLLGAHAASISWTCLFSATSLTAIEMYRKGVRSNAIYDFRDESFMIGIGGDSGAGKHTIARDLTRLLETRLSVINGDDDHKWERGHVMWRRFTHLDPRGNLLNTQLESIAALRRGGDVRKRHYDHDAGRFTNPLVIKPNEFVAVVGLHPFYLPSQRELIHLKIFVDPKEELRRKWKVARDMAKRGYSEAQVIEQIEKRMADSVSYVRPQMKYADIVLRQGDTDPARPHHVDLELEMVSELEPLALYDALDMVSSLEVSWTPDEQLTRDKVTVRGDIDPEQIAALADSLLPDADELVHDVGWLTGGRGIAQLAIVYAIGVRLSRARTREIA
ncbi:hypothetical protein [Pendulispora albinea]|uniref:phosphoribulokinase n=1 Tax=Pendulispora albinea TaxID=2741071 RepID=A0ABZ2LPC7_9BACT